MVSEEAIQKATCRVDINGDQRGSAFWINGGYLVSAAHVFNQNDEEDCTIRPVQSEPISVEVVHYDSNTNQNPGSDLAVLQPARLPDWVEPLTLDTSVPTIGTDVVWSGYARLFGEPPIDKQRFGWGRVASEVDGEENAEFFEVDGLFNPSHSGGPVVSEETGQVVGVVSASARAFDSLEAAWQRRAELLDWAFTIYQEATTGGSGFRSTAQFDNPVHSVQMQRRFDQLGIDYDVSVQDDGVSISFFRAAIPGKAGFLLAELSDLLLETARNTFQMGVGIASGGTSFDEIDVKFNRD